MEGAGPVRLRPLDVGRILDVSIKIFLRHWLTLFKIVIVVLAPVQVLAVLITASTAPDDYDASGGLGGGGGTQTADDIEVAFVIGQLAVSLLSLLVFLLAQVACFKAVADAYLGERPRAGESLAYAGRRFHSVLWLGFLMTFFLIFAFIALIIPGIWLAVAWAVAFPVLLLEGQRGLKALRRSFRLVRGRWWPTFGILLLGTILATVVSGMVQGIVLAILFVSVDTTSFAALVLSGVAGLLGQLVTVPFQAAFLTVVYFDLRVRKEGLDIELLAQDMDLPGAPGADFLPAEPPQWAPPGQQGWAPPGEQGWAPPDQQGWAPPRPPEPGQDPGAGPPQSER